MLNLLKAKRNYCLGAGLLELAFIGIAQTKSTCKLRKVAPFPVSMKNQLGSGRPLCVMSGWSESVTIKGNVACSPKMGKLDVPSLRTAARE